jgi:hypothetical protein
MTDNHIIKAPEMAIQQEKMHPLVNAAMRGGEIDPETLSRLMDLQERWEASEAKKAFTQAMVELKANLPSVLDRDRLVNFGKTKFSFTTLAHAMEAISPHLTRFGFSLSWPVAVGKNISVTCRLTHTDGHYEETTMMAPADNSGSKNAVQAIGSTVSYLQRYTALSLLGIATADMKCADDQELDSDTVDVEANLKAIAYMQSVGISPKDAEEHVQRDVKSWTSSDLKKLRELIKSRKGE